METDLRYPVGKFQRAENLSDTQRASLICAVAEAPAKLRQAVAGLTEQQLDTPYRPGGWTVRQVVHHLPDSHMNSFIRFKLGLTENEPTIKTYDEASWAKLADAKAAIEPSLVLFESLHTRWLALLNSLSPADWKRTVRHPEMGPMTLDSLLQLYAWHGRHHVAHITSLRERNGWR
ncbi:MAG TPA: bacillithiol transferase BstA [Candidatus Acidoferrum sp.]|nr:bacillithiol transferase BstA [Candidatus Acidoferrum sp.]